MRIIIEIEGIEGYATARSTDVTIRDRESALPMQSATGLTDARDGGPAPSMPSSSLSPSSSPPGSGFGTPGMADAPLQPYGPGATNAPIAFIGAGVAAAGRVTDTSAGAAPTG